MSNFLSQGYEIERADGTRDTYYGWSMDEIRAIEACRGSVYFRYKEYKIENEFHRYTYDEKAGIFRDFNEPMDEITVLETDYAIAGYLWRTATEADEDSVRAYKLMAIDIFGDFERWRAMAFWYMMKEFERDVDFLKEATR